MQQDSVRNHLRVVMQATGESGSNHQTSRRQKRVDMAQTHLFGISSLHNPASVQAGAGAGAGASPVQPQPPPHDPAPSVPIPLPHEGLPFDMTLVRIYKSENNWKYCLLSKNETDKGADIACVLCAEKLWKSYTSAQREAVDRDKFTKQVIKTSNRTVSKTQQGFKLSNFTDHLMKHHNFKRDGSTTIASADAPKRLGPMDSVVVYNASTVEMIHRSICEFIIDNDLAVSIVDAHSFRTMAVNMSSGKLPYDRIYSRHTITRRIHGPMFDDIVHNIKASMKMAEAHRFTVQWDSWTLQ